MSVTRVVVLSASSVLTPVTEGGAQRWMRTIVQAVIGAGHSCEVLVTENWRVSADPSADFWPAPGRQEALYLEELSGDQGFSRREVRPDDALRWVEEADLVVVLDRHLGQLPGKGRKVLAVSNLAYASERVGLVGPWDEYWTMSPFLSSEVERLSNRVWGPSRVFPPVIEHSCRQPDAPTIDQLRSSLRERGIDRRHTLLFPHRCDPEKGLPDVLHLFRALLDREPEWHLVVVEPSHYELPEKLDFFASTMRLAEDLKVVPNLSTVPWLPQGGLCDLYRLAGCTVMASVLPEGFGLVPYESVLHGTPCVARRTGALDDDAVLGMGIELVDEIISAEAVSTVRSLSGHSVGAAPERIRERYSRDNLGRIVAGALTGPWSAR